MDKRKLISSEENDLLPSGENKFNWRKEILFISMFASNMFAFISYGLIAPLFPEEATAKGVSYSIQGWIFGSFALTQFLASPLIGKVMLSIGFRWTFIIGILFLCIWNILFGFLPWIEYRSLFIISCFVCRIGMALGLCAVNNAVWVIVTLTWPQDVAFRLGTIETTMGIGTMIGPSCAGKVNIVGN